MLSSIFCINVGEIISEKDKCGFCKGEKVVQQKKVLEVHIEKGMQHGQKITFPGEADEAVSRKYPHPEFIEAILSCLTKFI